MARNKVDLMNLQPGATWTFVHSDGKRTEYVYDRQIIGGCPDPKNPGVGLDAMHALLNPATGKCAEVSEKWLREGPVTSGASSTGLRSHWVVGERAAVEAQAA